MYMLSNNCKTFIQVSHTSHCSHAHSLSGLFFPLFAVRELSDCEKDLKCCCQMPFDWDIKDYLCFWFLDLFSYYIIFEYISHELF